MNKNLLRAPIELASRFNKNTETQTASYRSDFMRDRDRIMYCNAFRRLDGKTQIYLIAHVGGCSDCAYDFAGFGLG